ncbi:MAG: diadenosine tetraphosphate hydrolase [Thermoplasmata archaeon]|nr:diadenosine tetraphosphate hydrolase [Thermoplasmata archaeon]
MNSCPFCEILEQGSREILWQDGFAFAIRDAYPISPGHSLVITKRHVGSFWDCTSEEKASLMAGAEWLKEDLDGGFSSVGGWNLGINVGESAGQTVYHVHLHVIPRFEGDVEDPTGGVRGSMPGEANYHHSA